MTGYRQVVTGPPRVAPPDNFTRLNGRVRRAGAALLFAYPVMLLVLFLTQPFSATMVGVHLGMYALVLAFARFSGERNALVVFFVTHCFWFYSFSLILYALVYQKSPEQDLYAPVQSSGIAAVALFASICGYGLAGLLRRVLRLPRQRAPLDPEGKARLGSALILLCLPFSLLPVVRDLSIFNSLSGLFFPLTWLGLMLLAAGRGVGIVRSPAVYLLAGSTLALSVALNTRSGFLALALALLLVYLAVARRAFRVTRLVMAYLAFNFINALSLVTLSARMVTGHSGAAPLVLKSMFSTDFLLAVLGFNTLQSSAVMIEDQLKRQDQYLLYMFDGRLGLFERLTQLPHMDIVVARLPDRMPVAWDQVKSTILSSLPSFGQAKDLMFNDRLAWDTGLIVYGNVGHPLVTAAGEFYSMGGFGLLFVVFTLLVGVTLYWHAVLRRVLQDEFAAVGALVMFTLYLVFSSTSVSALAPPIRIYPVALLAIGPTRALLRTFAPRSRRVLAG